MSLYRRIRKFAAIATLASVAGNFAVTGAHAGKEVFVRTKPHVNVGTLGQVNPQQPMIAPAPGNGGQAGGPGGPRKDKIDLSVCELGTFDHGKCLGGE